jgi:hypothetical protein
MSSPSSSSSSSSSNFLDLDYVDEKEHLKFTATTVMRYIQECTYNGSLGLWNVLATLLDVAGSLGLKCTSRIEDGGNTWIFSIHHGLQDDDGTWSEAGRKMLLDVFAELSLVETQVSSGSGWLEVEIKIHSASLDDG